MRLFIHYKCGADQFATEARSCRPFRLWGMCKRSEKGKGGLRPGIIWSQPVVAFGGPIGLIGVMQLISSTGFWAGTGTLNARPSPKILSSSPRPFDRGEEDKGGMPPNSSWTDLNCPIKFEVARQGAKWPASRWVFLAFLPLALRSVARGSDMGGGVPEWKVGKVPRPDPAGQGPFSSTSGILS